jgi:hypothetical protein
VCGGKIKKSEKIIILGYSFGIGKRTEGENVHKDWSPVAVG